MAATFFHKIKMHRGEQEGAKHQLRMAVLGNWRDGVVAMGGVICMGGLVSNYKRLFCGWGVICMWVAW